MKIITCLPQNSCGGVKPDFESGYFTPDLIQGGEAIELDDGCMRWQKTGKLVVISFATWVFKIKNPTDKILLLSLPFANATTRVIGMMGYNNSGVNMIPASSEGNKAFLFSSVGANGATHELRGNEFPENSILQFEMIYVTD